MPFFFFLWIYYYADTTEETEILSVPLLFFLSSFETPPAPLDPTAEPSSSSKSPSKGQRKWTIGPGRGTSLGSVTPRHDDRVEPVLVVR